MANEIKSPRVPATSTPVVPEKTLHDKEAAKVAQQIVHDRRSVQDAQRAAQQAGFQRSQQKRGKGLDIGDSSRAPIPIPDDEADTETWDPNRLDNAQQNLSMASTQFAEAEIGASQGVSVAESLVGGSFLPTEDGIAKLQALADKSPPQALPLGEVSTAVRHFFNIDMGEKVPPGQKMLVTGLVVAGEAGSVEVTEAGLNEQKLAQGLKKVTERSNQSVGEAQKMSKGVALELNRQRTFVVKR